MITHSDKAIETMAQMKTKPEDWGQTEIKWVKEMILREVQENCRTCYGHGRTYVYEKKAIDHDGIRALLRSKFGIDRGGSCLWGGDAEKVGAAYDACPACRTTRTRYASSGKVWVWKKVETWVGYVQWAPGTKFASRFVDNDCQLCSKTLQKGWGDGYWRRVPVTAKRADGTIVGMWVGPDCGRKFFGIKNFKDDHVIKEVA